MATPKWQPGKLYPPGSLVVPRTALPNVPVVLQDPGFESGTLDGWDIEIDNPGVTTPNVTNYNPYNGTYNLMFDTAGGAPRTTIIGLNKAQPTCQPGTLITANIWLKFSEAGGSGGQAVLAFFDADDNLIGDLVLGVLWQKPGNRSELWYNSSVTGVAPAGTVTVRAGFKAFVINGADIRFDVLGWNYNSAAPIAGLQYRAVQPTIGTSADVEPAWPPVLGVQVVDNDVIWEAVLLTRVVWKARSVLRSGATEPAWPTTDGARVTDNTISWEAISRRVTDPKCPNSKQVVIAAGKVFGLDEDIAPYSATVNPLDWSTPEDAGYLPIGLQQYGANPFVAMGLYRNYIAVFNAQGGQLWQPDEDPQQMAQLDAFPIGTQFHEALAPVNDELFILTEAGVRTIGMSAGSGNLQSGDVGMFVDPLVLEAVAAAKARGIVPRSLYNPNAGQYWLMFADPTAVDENDDPDPHTLVMVYTMTRAGNVGAWSRYLLPFAVDHWIIHGDELVLRAGRLVVRMDVNLATDARIADGEGEPVVETRPFGGRVWWPYLDFGQPGVTKRMHGIDVVSSGAPSVSIGYDQRNLETFTAAYALPADTLPAGVVRMAVAAPTLSVRIDFAPGQRWALQAVTLYLNDNRVGT